MGREPSSTKMDSHKTERFLRRITMLMRLQRIKARMATSSASSRPPPPAILPSRDRQRSAPSNASSQRPSVAPVPTVALSSVLQRSGRASIVLHSDRQQRSEASSKRSLRFSHRRRQSEQVRRQLERQAGSEQQPVARVRVVAVVMVPHRGGRQSSGGSSRSSRRRSRRSQARELPGRPHVLNLVRRLLGRVESMAATPEEDTNGGRIFVSQAQNERTPEKGNQSGEGDDQKTG